MRRAAKLRDSFKQLNRTDRAAQKYSSLPPLLIAVEEGYYIDRSILRSVFQLCLIG